MEGSYFGKQQHSFWRESGAVAAHKCTRLGPARTLNLGYCPHRNSWIVIIKRFYKTLNRTPDIDCYGGEGGGGAVPNLNPKP